MPLILPSKSAVKSVITNNQKRICYQFTTLILINMYGVNKYMDHIQFEYYKILFLVVFFFLV